jgi:hypothetical protein
MLASWACRQQSRVDAGTERQVYRIAPGDSVSVVRVSVRNRGSHPVYLQAVDGRLDLLVLVRVDAQGRVVTGGDTTGRQRWSLFFHRKSTAEPRMGVVRLEPDSALTAPYLLPRGQYRSLVHFGEKAESLDQHGVWLERFSIH